MNNMTEIDKMIDYFKSTAKAKQNIDKTIENEYVNKKDLIDCICQVTGCSYFSPVIRAIIEFPKSK